MNWRSIKESKPDDGQRCLTKMKHGIIEGFYSAEDDTFSKYYWREMDWYATHWIPIEDVE